MERRWAVEAKIRRFEFGDISWQHLAMVPSSIGFTGQVIDDAK